MTEPKSFRERIQQRLKGAQETVERERQAMQQHMVELERRQEQFNAIADGLISSVLHPRMRELVEQFDNAQLDEDGDAHCVRCKLRHSIRFPATAYVALRVTHDKSIEQLCVQYQAEILPVFIQYERHDELRFPLNTVEETQVAAWAEQRLLGFVESYLQIEANDQYQRENLATDPVCSMRISKARALPLEHHGQTYYFCTKRCRERFSQDPDRFVATAAR